MSNCGHFFCGLSYVDGEKGKSSTAIRANGYALRGFLFTSARTFIHPMSLVDPLEDEVGKTTCRFPLSRNGVVLRS